MIPPSSQCPTSGCDDERGGKFGETALDNAGERTSKSVLLLHDGRWCESVLDMLEIPMFCLLEESYFR